MKDNNTGKPKDFYSRGKEIFDQIKVLEKPKKCSQAAQPADSVRSTWAKAPRPGSYFAGLTPRAHLPLRSPQPKA